MKQQALPERRILPFDIASCPKRQIFIKTYYTAHMPERAGGYYISARM